MPCKYCEKDDFYVTEDSIRSVFGSEIPPYLEGKLKKDEQICKKCLKILEKSFVQGVEFKDLPLYINFNFIFKEHKKVYLERLKSAQ